VIDTYRVRRRCLVADRWREYGELVPEAHTWRLVESEVATGSIERTRVSGQEFSDAIERFCPELADELHALFGVEPAITDGPDLRPAEYPSDDELVAVAAGDDADRPRRGRVRTTPPRGPVLTKPPEALEG
jgi:hypothetical protein